MLARNRARMRLPRLVSRLELRLRESYLLASRLTCPSPSQEGRVHPPRGVAKRGRESDPGQIRDQQRRGEAVAAPKQQDRREDQRPEQENFRKRDGPEMPRKEEPAPQRVGGELRHEQDKGASGRARS